MTQIISDLLPLLRNKINGPLERQLIDHLKKSYRQFCIGSDIAQETESLVCDADHQLTLTPSTENFVLNIIAIRDTVNAVDLFGGVDFTIDLTNKVTCSDEITNVDVTYSVVPKFDVSDEFIVNDIIMYRWPDEITCGAAATLMGIQGAPWTNPEMSKKFERDHVQAYCEARSLQIKNTIDPPQLAVCRDFF